MRLAILVEILPRLAWWDWHMIEHACREPDNTHPSGLATAIRGLEELIELAKEFDEKDLATQCAEHLNRIRQASKAKREKGEPETDA